ncbi:LysR family transcriptional regulator [Rhodococcus sp. D2-41]|uniref:LysR family transcriptional regulator n=1 Tax=Speluncibacter jeojiensis TaxID=2710754 RepID=A0A9X4RE85_9ACTN|nr:LysR family transcriptional regulator [Rhodococcus sp. D2-41]MDG3011714.1 LysR family transcriptional regulator [Rhodococcus sp. D2-41]MDG3014932.1 LysR family transcriptional regulator [Corynebacteriales bacterium D3-21]
MLELRLLGYIVAVAEEGGVSGAARRLGVTQPTLSRQLKDLERRLGVELFERDGRHLTPTDAGAALVRRSTALLAAAEAAVEDVRFAAEGRSGQLTVAFAGSGINGPLGAALGRVRRELPRVALRLEESFSDTEMSQGVLDGRFDMAVQRLPLRDARLVAQEWWHEPLTFFLPEGHPLAGSRGPAPLTELGRIPLVLWPRDVSPQSHDEIYALCARAGVVPRIGAEGRSVQTVLALVAAGFGGAVMSQSHRALRRVGVVPRDLAGTRTTLHLVGRAADRSPLVERFREVLADVVEGRNPPTDTPQAAARSSV